MRWTVRRVRAVFQGGPEMSSIDVKDLLLDVHRIATDARIKSISLLKGVIKFAATGSRGQDTSYSARLEFDLHRIKT